MTMPRFSYHFYFGAICEGKGNRIVKSKKWLSIMHLSVVHNLDLMAEIRD